MSTTAVSMTGLRKRYGKTHALRGLDLTVSAGAICGLLGPNGAGTTTAVRVLATLAAPASGHASVAGYDVVRRADEVRRRIGFSGQHAALDGGITGLIVLIGKTRSPACAAISSRRHAIPRKNPTLNPVSCATSAARSLFGDTLGAAATSPWPLAHPVEATLAWRAALLALFMPLAVRAFSTHGR
jgi:ABC-type cobalamin/Fe3+-siderophores transport system ATPase subunit